MKSTNLREEIKNSFFSFLQKNEYTLMEITGYSIIKSYFYLHKDTINKNFVKCQYSQAEILKNKDIKISGDNKFNSEEIKKTFLLESWKNENLKDKIYIKELEYFINISKKNELLNFVLDLPINNEEKVKFISNLPVSLLDAYNVIFTDVKKLIDETDLTEDKKEKFYFNFFKARKNQLKGATGQAAESFLIDLYKDELDKLKPYGVFFQNIKNKFEDINLDIEEPGIGIFAIKLNIRKAAKILDGISEANVKEYIDAFTYGYAKRHKIWASSEVVDKSKNVIECIVYKKDINTILEDNCSFENFRDKIKEFLIEISIDSIKVNSEYVEKWLLKNEIDENLKNEEIKIKNKEFLKSNKI